MDPIAKSSDEETSSLDCDPGISPDALGELAEAVEEAGALDCCETGRFKGMTIDVDLPGALLDEEPFTVDVDSPFEEDKPVGDTEEPFEVEDDEPLDGVEEPLGDVDEGPVEDVEEGPPEDKVAWKAAICATGIDEGAVGIPAVEDIAVDVEPADESFGVEDWPLSSVTGQTVV